MKRSLRVITVVTLALLTSCGWLLAQVPEMAAHFIKVGQADATLLEFPCGALLIDAGAQDDQFADRLVQYIASVFTNRPDLHNTLEAIYITHPHLDHTYALKKVAQAFTVKRYIDNGQTTGSGIPNVKWIRAFAVTNHIVTRTILNSEVMAEPHGKGITDEIIDPLKCDKCDPVITIFSGQWDTEPDWSNTELNDKNNHSLVIRVDFGQSSFFFTGDMETTAISSLLGYYAPSENCSKLFSVDVWHVGHHGSDNATTAELLAAVHPALAIISVGHWDYGKNEADRYNTWNYGHPRKATIDLLSASIQGTRSDRPRVKVATAARQFSSYTIKKKIYATDWDGNVVVRASLDHDVQVSINN
jgi:beta-lactamase superfamily II metal-dependent hydrolase